ncbi:protein of unknown function [Candidatus Methylomirabilis oxygeniifera]|uniref:Uncharacterized protein n=1 Tax=Methylomirabilis oxygeniifera TaxID=671143 RepID=D5MM52_METO1|nr:protein of unknown function [Candidatus Methylomirabilis oxyfera]
MSYSFSFLRTSQMNPSLCSGRSVIVCLRIAVVPKDRLVIIPSLRHMIWVAGATVRAIRGMHDHDRNHHESSR